MLYGIAKGILWPVFHLMHRYKIIGAEHIPKEGGVIICANHARGIDALYLALAINRRLFFVAKGELFKTKPVGGVLRALGAFPVDRSVRSDLTMYKNAVKVLGEGFPLLIFVQGHRMKELRADNGKGGAALFALKTGTPLVPVGLSCTYKPFCRININVGAPVDLSEFEGEKLRAEVLDRATEKIMRGIIDLVEAADR